MKSVRIDRDFKRSGRDFIIGDVMRLVNGLSPDFYSMESGERMEMIQRETPPGFLRRFAEQALVSGSYAELASRFYGAAAALGDVSSIVVQTAQVLDAKQRLSWHSDLRAQYPAAFVRFETYPDLVGGIRIFANGTLVDASWRGRLQSILSRVVSQS